MEDKLPRKIDKPWGYEILFAHTEKYAGKLLFLKAGLRLSLQYHEVKDETLYLYQGKALIETDTPTWVHPLSGLTLMSLAPKDVIPICKCSRFQRFRVHLKPACQPACQSLYGGQESCTADRWVKDANLIIGL